MELDLEGLAELPLFFLFIIMWVEFHTPLTWVVVFSKQTDKSNSIYSSATTFKI